MQPVLQYQAFVEPIATQIPITLDMWWQPAQRPIFQKLPTQREGFFVSPWYPIPPHHGSTGIPDVSTGVHARWPYQSYIKPLEPSLFVVPSLESWHRQQDEPHFRIRRNTESLGFYVQPLEPSLFVVPFLESWHRQQSEPLFRKRTAPEGGAVFVQIVVQSFVDTSWVPPTQQPADKRRRDIESLGWYDRPLEPSLFVIPDLESWHRQQSEPIFVKHRIQDTNQLYFKGWFIIDWLQPIQQPKRQLVTFPVGGATPFTIFQVSLDWMIENEVPRRRISPLPPSGSIGPLFDIDVPARLAWAYVAPFQPISRRSPEGQFAFLFPQQQVTVTLDMWWQEPQIPVRQRLAAIEALQEFIPVIATVAIAVPCPYRPLRTDDESVVDLSVDEGEDQSAFSVQEVHVSWMRLDGMDVQMPMRVAETVTGAGRTDEAEVRAMTATDAVALAGRAEQDENREGRADEPDTRAASGDPGDDARDGKTDDGGDPAIRRDECSE